MDAVTKTTRRYAIGSLAVVLLVVGKAVAGGVPVVIVNGAVLDPQIRRALEVRYGTRVLPGRYWYDTVSGLWGEEGGPSVGQIAPGMRLGPLAADASVQGYSAHTFVFVNGREIHPREAAYLRDLYGSVTPGRYWLNAQGIAGYEGGPPQFDLRAAAMERGFQANGGHTRRGAFGNTGSDGQCSYYNDADSGASVLTGSC